jgi:hypothetical protein
MYFVAIKKGLPASRSERTGTKGRTTKGREEDAKAVSIRVHSRLKVAPARTGPALNGCKQSRPLRLHRHGWDFISLFGFLSSWLLVRRGV